MLIHKLDFVKKSAESLFLKNIALRAGLKGLKGLLFAERDSID